MTSSDENYIILYGVVRQLNDNTLLLSKILSLYANQIYVSRPLLNLLNYGYKICYRFHHLFLPVIYKNALFYNHHTLLHLLGSLNKKKKINNSSKYVKFNRLLVNARQKKGYIPEISHYNVGVSKKIYEEETKIFETKVQDNSFYNFNLTAFRTKFIQFDHITVPNRIKFEINGKLLTTSPIIKNIRKMQDNNQIYRGKGNVYSLHEILFKQSKEIRQILYRPVVKKPTSIIQILQHLLSAKETEQPLLIIQPKQMGLPFQDLPSSNIQMNLNRTTISISPSLSSPSHVFQIAKKSFGSKKKSDSFPGGFKLLSNKATHDNAFSISVSSGFGIRNKCFYDITEDDNIHMNKLFLNNIGRLIVYLPRILSNSIKDKFKITENKFLSKKYAFSKNYYSIDFSKNIFFKYINLSSLKFDGTYFSQLKAPEIKKIYLDVVTKAFTQDIKKAFSIPNLQSLKRIHLHKEPNNQLITGLNLL